MTARFGRNKRRAARAAVEAARAEAELARTWVIARENALRETLEFYSGRLERAESAMRVAQGCLGEVHERIVPALGPDSALLPLAMQVATDRGMGGPVPWRKAVPRRDVDRVPLDAALDTQIVEAGYVELHRLVVKVCKEPDQFARLVRFVDEARYFENDRPVTERAYMISDDAMRVLGMRRDVRFFAEDIARQLLEMQGDRHG